MQQEDHGEQHCIGSSWTLYPYCLTLTDHGSWATGIHLGQFSAQSSRTVMTGLEVAHSGHLSQGEENASTIPNRTEIRDPASDMLRLTVPAWKELMYPHVHPFGVIGLSRPVYTSYGFSLLSGRCLAASTSNGEVFRVAQWGGCVQEATAYLDVVTSHLSSSTTSGLPRFELIQAVKRAIQAQRADISFHETGTFCFAIPSICVHSDCWDLLYHCINEAHSAQMYSQDGCR